ncbi:rhomboid family intramembrane serine protease [Ornithinimicrobium cryptoxanthini]|uniref:Rhomboid family intramembrane serine protease n=1 Tax=Ornithinimicrobium cryptoxanthini TaxID=2934161 RepID=A0ABY4YG52_9MICO|nr:rhomboid family intramembrane serine protease [Ornithinimicrobium cryptoxanthini]USQ75333.1 rhomboid family intramembrane serine protease [Ornithinimicrobium cryptoxanthini]
MTGRLLQERGTMPFLKRLMRSPAVLALVATQVVLFVAGTLNPVIWDVLSLPGDVAGLVDRPWSPLTVMFVHANVAHLAVMVLMLAAFGPLLEQVARSWAVLAVYLTAGLAGSFAVMAVVQAFETDGSLMGSSAAVFGVAAAVLALDPSARVFGGKATQWLGVLVAVNIAFLLSQPLGSVAHLAGLAVGVAYGRWVVRRQREPVEEHAKARTT